MQVQLEALQMALENLASKRGPEVAFWGYVQPTINFSPLPSIPSTSRGTYIQIVELSKPQIRRFERFAARPERRLEVSSLR
jgi:hypothetical protein